MQRFAAVVVVMLAVGFAAPAVGAQEEPTTTSSSTTTSSTTSSTTSTTTTTTALPAPVEPAPTVPAQAVAPEPPAAVESTGAAAAAETAAQSQCDPNYKGACVPVRPGGDVDCAEVGARVFVVGEDPYRLDEGGEPGIGCEEYGAASTPTTGSTGSTGSTAPAQVAGQQLANTGSTSGPLLLAGLVLLLVGLVVIGRAAVVADPLRGRLRAGYQVTATNRYGEQFTYTVAPSRRR